MISTFLSMRAVLAAML